MTLGERLRAAMEARGLSAEAVGRALGVTGAAVRKWRPGDHEPDVRTLVALADLTGASLLWLLEGDEAPPEPADWAVAFADLVASGADPAAALSTVSGGAASLAFPEPAAARRRAWRH